MNQNHSVFNETLALKRIRHYLPSQAPLKDFVHHNTLHAFQHDPFHKGLHKASVYFGYRVYLPLNEYRNRYRKELISEQALRYSVEEIHGKSFTPELESKLISEPMDETIHERIGRLHKSWKSVYRLNLPKQVHPRLFRIISTFLDQGVSIRPFPQTDKGLIDSLKEMSAKSFVSIFSSARVNYIFKQEDISIKYLLDLLVGEESLYAQYLFDQQFAHPGWSGMVSMIEQNPESLLDRRKISLHDFILLELLFELDTVTERLGDSWMPLGKKLKYFPGQFNEPLEEDERFTLLAIWQDAMEWSQYLPALGALTKHRKTPVNKENTRFYALFCIDDRECSIRRYVEETEPQCETFGTPGFFNVAFYFQPQHSEYHTKLCPAPMTPVHLIKESSKLSRTRKELPLTKKSHALLTGWLIAQTLGFWAALKLFFSIFRPSITRTTTYSFRHMDGKGDLSIEFKGEISRDGYRVGFTYEEMADRVEGLLKSIGLTGFRATLVYVVGHGASSVNNTHYAGYDCGACCGRPGSVNARVLAYMANHPEVRKLLAERDIRIPDEVQFVGALHDTTRDEIEYYDLQILNAKNKLNHAVNRSTFKKALELNAVERARRFELTDSSKSAGRIHEQVKKRSVSLFEPRPELNHATNYLCIIAGRQLTRGLFLDRRAFLNSYDWQQDRDGVRLANILNAATPVCGGINLEYFFSRMDPNRLGAGSKLPHNVMGLIGVANGLDGDLRPGLPYQMVEVHDPLRLMMVIEQKPEVVLNVLNQHPGTLEWYRYEWIILTCIHPESGRLFRFTGDHFEIMNPGSIELKSTARLDEWVRHFEDNLPVMELNNQSHV